jgi:hypothetical protein
MTSLRPFRTPLRGHAFAAPPPEGGPPRSGQRAVLRREPGNPVDDLAVAVWLDSASGWWRAGYLDRGVAARLAPRMDAGMRLDAKVEGWVAEPEGRWQRPLVLVSPTTRGPGASDGRAPREGGAATATARGPSADDHPRLWGRPPGVAVRTITPAVSAGAAAGSR